MSTGIKKPLRGLKSGFLGSMRRPMLEAGAHKALIRTVEILEDLELDYLVVGATARDLLAEMAGIKDQKRKTDETDPKPLILRHKINILFFV
jgi:hypothetical protein